MIPTIIIRFFGLCAQVITAFRLIKLFDLTEYGNYVVYIFEANIFSVFFSFGVITFNVNNLVKKEEEEFYKNNAEIILISSILLITSFVYFFLKYQSFSISVILLIFISLKILQNICYSGVLGEKGIGQYNIYLNSQLITFMLVTYIPNMSILNLLFVWMILTFINVLFLKKYIIHSLSYINIKSLNVTSFKNQINKSLYDFNNNFINRYELIILSFFEKYAIMVGLLSVFMQIGDSLVNFFKTLAPKIQITATNNSQKIKKLHTITFVCFSLAVGCLFLTYKFWMKFLKAELLSKQIEYGLWSVMIIFSIVLWSYRYELQGKNFNIKKYNLINIFLIVSVSILSIIFANNFFTLIIVRGILLVSLIMYTFNLSRKNIE